MAFVEHRLDGALLRFDRATSTNVLLRGPSTVAHRRVAPRTLQVGLLTPCNLRCSFCYRDTSAPSLLTEAFLVDLLERASRWGVLEVAFGGGEPLLFRGFVPMLEKLHRTTPLGLGFTTNGVLLDDATIHALRGVVSEIRVSAYEDNGYRGTLGRLSGFQAGINWLVTPANVGLVEPHVADFLERGASNVLLLGYKGDDPSLHLDEDDFEVLRRALARLEGAPLRLDVCWQPHLRDVGLLFRKGDCGAGDEFMVITPDRAVQACSFAGGRVPFDTFEDLVRIYGELRAARPEAAVTGCTRSLFVAPSAPEPRVDAAWVWQAAASNNSGDWTIAARFCDEETAARVAEELRTLARAHEAFLASDEGQEWVEKKGFDGSFPTPPLVAFGKKHGFDWSRHGDGLWWEEDGCGAPVLTAGAVGDAVVVFHPYCMGLPEKPFRAFFRKAGATELGYWQYGRPRVVARAMGRNKLAEKKLEAFLVAARAQKYPSDIKEEPPWGKSCADKRLLDDEDKDARLGAVESLELEVADDGIRIALPFENTFAGSLALHAWLKKSGYGKIEIAVEPVLRPIGRR